MTFLYFSSTYVPVFRPLSTPNSCWWTACAIASSPYYLMCVCGINLCVPNELLHVVILFFFLVSVISCSAKHAKCTWVLVYFSWKLHKLNVSVISFFFLMLNSVKSVWVAFIWLVNMLIYPFAKISSGRN